MRDDNSKIKNLILKGLMLVILSLHIERARVIDISFETI